MLFLTEQLMLSKGIRATTPVYFKVKNGFVLTYIIHDTVNSSKIFVYFSFLRYFTGYSIILVSLEYAFRKYKVCPF